MHDFLYPLILCELDIPSHIKDIYEHHIDATVSILNSLS